MNKLINYKQYYREIAWLAFSFVVGFALSVTMVSDLIYNPTTVNYLSYDMIVHFIGWDYFRHSPWGWPLTYTQNLVYPIGTNLIYSDSIPLLSVILKLFSPLLPQPFVWHGLVAIINLSLLFYSGSLFFRVMRNSQLLGLIGGCFVMIAAPAIFRLAFHYSLTSQWLLVFNLLLIMKPSLRIKTDICWQIILIFISCGIHPYLACMNIGLSFALAYKLSFANPNTLKVWLITFIRVSLLFCSTFIFSTYFWGWFVKGADSAAAGYGYYSANLLSLVNPEHGSFLLKNIPIGAGQYEGYAYLGCGVLIGLGLALLLRHKLIWSKLILIKFYGLYIVLAVFFLLSLSNLIQIGSYTINLPYSGKFFDTFRSSGRFIWPLYYFIVLSTIVLVYDSFKNRQIGLLVLFVLFFIQYWDLAPRINDIASLHASNRAPRVTWNNDLLAKFWYQLPQNGYKHLAIPEDYPGEVANLGHWWSDNYQFPIIYKFALLADQNHLSLSEMHLARRSQLQDSYIQQQNQKFMSGFLEVETLYIVKSDILAKRDSQLNQRQCTKIDNYNICAQNVDSIKKYFQIAK